MSEREDFDCFTLEHPIRCTLCSRMYPIGTTFAWVDSSYSAYHRGDDYESLSIGSKQSKSRTGCCLSCIEAAPRRNTILTEKPSQKGAEE